MKKLFACTLMLGVIGWVGGQRTTAQQSGSAVRQQGAVTSFTAPSGSSNATQIDFANAQEMPMPSVDGEPRGGLLDSLLARTQAPQSPGGVAAGGDGNGTENEVTLATGQAGAASPEPNEFGTSNPPFSTARADTNKPTNKMYPYRAAGKLFFNIGESSFLCSASLIKPGIVVTAAHCVANYGRSQFYSNWQFVPGYRNGVAPYGVWTATSAWIMTSYYNGTDGCAVFGVVCPNDVALIVLNPNSVGKFAGKYTGWLGYGWNGYGFTGGITQISQLGYPVCLDNGLFMERNDSYGYTSSSNSNNTVIGSLMCGGSSGGPWAVNLGIRPNLTGTSSGTAADPNIVVGVTSWGYTSTAIKEQGAAPFTSGNITVLISSACSGSTANRC